MGVGWDPLSEGVFAVYERGVLNVHVDRPVHGVECREALQTHAHPVPSRKGPSKRGQAWGACGTGLTRGKMMREYLSMEEG